MQQVVLTDPLDNAANANGEIPTVAAGTAGQVLASNGASSAPTFQTTTAITLGVTALTGSSDALPKSGLVAIGATGVDATTLATPTAGTDDGKVLTVLDTGGHAHTITTADEKIANTNDLLTFNGTVGSWVRLVAYNGFWWPVGLSGVTASDA